MAKQQINFRIDPTLLAKIKDRARKEGISYTQWIRNACISHLTVDPVVTFDEEEDLDVYTPTAIRYSKSNIQYSDVTLPSHIQDWEAMEESEVEETTIKKTVVAKPEDTLQEQVNRLSHRLRWESQYRQALETQVYYLKSMLVDAIADLEGKIARLEHPSSVNTDQQY